MDYHIDNNPSNNVNSNVENAPDMNANPPKKKSVLVLAVIITIVAVILITVGGVFAYQYFSTKTQPTTQTQTQNNSTQTADWKTYTNDQYGYELAYPNYMQFKEGACFALCPDDQKAFVSFENKDSKKIYFTINIIGNEFTTNGKPIGSLSLEEMAKSIWDEGKKAENNGAPSKIVVGNLNEVTLGGEKAYVFSSSNAIHLPWEGSIYDGKANLLFFTAGKNLKAYIIFDDKNREEVNKILSTFKFTDSTNTSVSQTTNQTAGWNTYRNIDPEFSIQYPKNFYPVKYDDCIGDCSIEFYGTATTSKISYFFIGVINNIPPTQTLKEAVQYYLSYQPGGEKLILKNSTVNGAEVIFSETLNEKQEVETKIYFFKNDKTLYLLNVPLLLGSDSPSMLSTFKFIPVK